MPLDIAVRENVRRTGKKLKSSKPVLSELVRKGKVEVMGAFCDPDTGNGEVL